MPNSYIETNFAEKSGIVACNTSWGRWWQSVCEIHIEIDIPDGTKANSVTVNIKPSSIYVMVKNNVIIEGPLYSVIHEDETVWTLEDKKKIYIVLVKAESITRETIWPSLLKNEYAADPLTLHEMRKKLDLENFQIENPGFDFSSAQLEKCYDKIPKPS